MFIVQRFSLVVLSAFMLAACGGGSGSDLNTGITNPPPSSPPPPPPPDEEEPAPPPEEEEPAPPPEDNTPVSFDSLFTEQELDGVEVFSSLATENFDADGEQIGAAGQTSQPPFFSDFVNANYDPLTDVLEVEYMMLGQEETLDFSFALRPEDLDADESTETFRIYRPGESGDPVEKAIVLQTGESQFNLQHIVLGAWSAPDLNLNDEFDTASGAFILGDTTARSLVPTTGSASYKGAVVGAGGEAEEINRDDKLYILFEGRMDAVVDFAEATIDLNFFEMQGTSLDSSTLVNLPDMSGSGSFNTAESFIVSLESQTAPEDNSILVQGGFFGPAEPFPAELGGTGSGVVDVTTDSGRLVNDIGVDLVFGASLDEVIDNGDLVIQDTGPGFSGFAGLFPDSHESADAFGQFALLGFIDAGTKAAVASVNPDKPKPDLFNITYDPAKDSLMIQYNYDRIEDNPTRDFEFHEQFELAREDIDTSQSTETFRVYTPEESALVEKAIVLQTGDPKFGFSHLTLGTWVSRDLGPESEFEAGISVFYFGDTTDPAQLPVQGTASYSGVVIGAGQHAEFRVGSNLEEALHMTILGDMASTVDFGAGELDVNFTSMVATLLRSGVQIAVPDLHGTADFSEFNGGEFFGNLNTADDTAFGTFRGAFFGPADPFPAEIAGSGTGLLDLQHGDRLLASTRIELSFGGVRD